MIVNQIGILEAKETEIASQKASLKDKQMSLAETKEKLFARDGRVKSPADGQGRACRRSLSDCGRARLQRP